MGLLTLVLIGAMAGAIAKVVMGDWFGWILTILVGVVGALLGGWVFSLFGGPSVTGFNMTSIFVATMGSILVLFAYGLIARRR